MSKIEQDPVKVCVHGARSPKRECIVQPVGPTVGCGGEDAADRHESSARRAPAAPQRWKGRRPCHVACRVATASCNGKDGGLPPTLPPYPKCPDVTLPYPPDVPNHVPDRARPRFRSALSSTGTVLGNSAGGTLGAGGTGPILSECCDSGSILFIPCPSSWLTSGPPKPLRPRKAWHPT
jgi:hypothetical protein